MKTKARLSFLIIFVFLCLFSPAVSAAETAAGNAPHVSGIEDKRHYPGRAMPVIQDGTGILDGIPYDGSPVTVPGQHVLEVTGADDSRQTITFYVDLTESGIADGGSYDGVCSYSFSGGTCYLDGRPYQSATRIDTVGNHELEIVGINDYSKTYRFTVMPVVSGLNDAVCYQAVFPSVEGDCSLLLDGRDFTGSSIAAVGQHTLTVRGTGGFERNYSFTIGAIQYDTASAGGNQWTLNVYHVHPDTEIYVDNAKITLANDGQSRQQYHNNVFGKHTVIITNNGKQTEQFDFTVDLQCDITNGALFTEPFTVDMGNALALKIDGVKADGAVRIDTNGRHDITFIGAGGYEKTVSVTFSNKHNQYALIMLIPAGIASLVVLLSVTVTSAKTKRRGLS